MRTDTYTCRSTNIFRSTLYTCRYKIQMSTDIIHVQQTLHSKFPRVFQHSSHALCSPTSSISPLFISVSALSFPSRPGHLQSWPSSNSVGNCTFTHKCKLVERGQLRHFPATGATFQLQETCICVYVTACMCMCVCVRVRACVCVCVRT